MLSFCLAATMLFASILPKAACNTRAVRKPMQKLENGTYDAYQCFQEGTSLNLPKDELDPVHFTTKVVTLKKGFPKVTGLYAMLDISIWELESEGDAIKNTRHF